MRPGRKKRTLTGQISRIVLVLILVGILEAGTAYTILEWYYDRVAELEYTISDIYLSEIDQSFNLINVSMRNMLYGGEEIQQVLEMQYTLPEYAMETEKLAYTLKRNQSVLQLKDTFAEMVLYYGSKINFFYIDPESQLLVENGGSEYKRRRAFCELLGQKLQEGEIHYTANGKWFLLEDYLCTVYKGKDGIGGAYLWAGDFAASILRMSPTDCSSIDIYDPAAQCSLVYERLENGLLTEGRRVDNAALPKNFYGLDHAQIVCRYEMDTSKYENAMILPVLFAWLLGIYLLVMLLVLLYTRRHVLGQVNTFYNHLIEYKETERFEEDTKIQEFAEAGKVLNQRSEEISQLKISIYEEQLSRQRVELDYAQLQIRPHFYINCLNIVHSMAQERLTHEIQELVVHISRYFRYIFKKGMEPVTVAKELEFTETYLRILECMNDTEYRYEVACEEDLGEAQIPPLLIQTFVENAVKHNLDEPAGCRIYVRVEKACGKGREWLGISVWDNGSGFEETVLERWRSGDFGTDKAGFHIGIRNAIARMKMIYGEEASVVFTNPEDGGARADIFIPLKEVDGQ